MTKESVFVSYSRKEFYFTESLVLHLQRSGIDAWFDVQQLEPGIGWKTDIRDGLERCKALVLVGSQSSLASQYVQAEVETAQKAGKPVYVVLFEPIVLPPELANPAALIDFTQGFDRGMSLLTTVIQENSTHSDPIPSGQALFLPEGVKTFVRLLRQREILWFILVIGFLIAVIKPITYLLSEEYRPDPASPLVFAPFILIWVLLGVIDGRYTFRMASKVERRENVPFNIWLKALNYYYLFFMYALFLLVTYVLVFRSFIFILPIFPLLYIGIRVYRANDITMQALLHPDVLRWCHLGNDVPFDWRLIVNQAVLPENMEIEIASTVVTDEDSNGHERKSELVTGVFLSIKGAQPTPKTFRLYSAPQIQAEADNIQRILQKNVFQELKESGVEPDFHILLLSPWTPVEVAQNLITEHPNNTLPILVAPANLSLLPTITTLQIIDFRNRYEPILASALQYLHTENDQQRSIFSFGVLPIRVSAVFPLREMRPLNRLVIYLASFCFLMGVFGMLSLLTRPSVDIRLILGTITYVVCFGFGFQFRRLATRLSNLTPGVGTTLMRWTIAALLFLAGMFLFELQPRTDSQSLYLRNFGNDIGWRLAEITFIVTFGLVIYIEIRRQIKKGRLPLTPVPLLGLPPIPPLPISIFIKYFVSMLIITVVMYVVVLMPEGSGASSFTSKQPSQIGSDIFFIGMIATLVIVLGASPMFSNDNTVFAISNAPALRRYLRSHLRSNPSPIPDGTSKANDSEMLRNT